MRILKTKNIAIFVAGLAACVCLAAYYALSYPCHILWQEQNQIFLNDSYWIATYFDKPAWAGCLAGEWLTQFYHNVIAGSIILTLSIAWATIAFASVLSQLLPKTATLLLSILFAILMIGCSLSSSTPLSFFICVAGGLSLGKARMEIIINRHKINLSSLMVILSYWAFGFGALLTALSMVLIAVRAVIRKSEAISSGLISSILPIIFAVATPAVLCRAYSLPYSKALLYPGIARPTSPQRDFENHLAIAEAFYRNDFGKVKELALGADSPDELTAFYYYLSCAVKDSLPENLMKYPVKNLGTLTTINDKTPLAIINMMNDLYFELGDMTYAERAAMMRNVFSPRNRNVRMVKRLAEINLVSGDTLAALKYLRILDHTLFHSDWSRRHMPGESSQEVETEISRRRIFSNHKDNIRLGDNCRNIILELLESNSGNSIALDYLLCTDLLLKDMDTFKMDYDTYCMEKGNPRYRDLYQQALMIYLAGTDASPEDWEKYIVSPEQMQLFQQYSNRRGDPAFKDTYWYYFDRQ